MGFKDLLRNTLPTLAVALGGPFGPAAAKAIGTALGKPDAKESDIPGIVNDALGVDPEVILKLKQVDNEFKLQMEKLGVDLLQIDAADRASARAREVEIKDSTPKILAFAVVALAFAAEAWLLVRGQPMNLEGVVLGRVMGTLDAALIMVLSYYFGSSSGS